MNAVAIRAKIERYAKELVEDTELFEALERATNDDILLRYQPQTGTSIHLWVSITEIDPLTVGKKDMSGIRLPGFQLDVSCTVFEQLKPGAALNKFLASRGASQYFTCGWATDPDSNNQVRLRLETRLVADTLDKVVFVNGIVHLLEDIEYCRAHLPAALHATGQPVY